jgi:hypothetical protein
VDRQTVSSFSTVDMTHDEKKPVNVPSVSRFLSGIN